MKRGADSYYVISRYADIKSVCKNTEVYGSNIVNILLDAGNGQLAMMSRPDVDVGPVDVLATVDPPIHTR